MFNSHTLHIMKPFQDSRKIFQFMAFHLIFEKSFFVSWICCTGLWRNKSILTKVTVWWNKKMTKIWKSKKFGELTLLRRMSRHFVSFSQLEISCISKVCENVCNIQKLLRENLHPFYKSNVLMQGESRFFYYF